MAHDSVHPLQLAGQVGELVLVVDNDRVLLLYLPLQLLLVIDDLAIGLLVVVYLLHLLGQDSVQPLQLLLHTSSMQVILSQLILKIQTLPFGGLNLISQSIDYPSRFSHLVTEVVLQNL